MSIQLTTIASGSAGNCIYIATEYTKILIDAGVSCLKIENALKDINITPEELDAVFITHEHADHVNGVGVLARKYKLQVFATEGTFNSLPSKVGKIYNKNIVYPKENILFNDLILTPIPVMHDAKEPVFYTVRWNNIKIAALTDLGCVTKDVLENIRHCNALVLESNHDITMLKEGAYPYHLKQRILSKYGHISNEIAAKILACVMNNNLKNVFLAHLSKENNTPDLAYLTIKNILAEFGITVKKDLNLHIAKEYGINELIKIF